MGAAMFKENRQIIFTGNGYSAEWPVEAEKRGLPNLKNTPAAIAAFNSEANKAVFSDMRVLSAAECDARAEVMYENYNTCVGIEAETLVSMVETGIIPACAKDLATYAAFPALGGKRVELYTSIKTEIDRLKDMQAAMH